MKLNAQLDVDVLALQQDDEVTCLLTLEAPIQKDDAARPGETLIVVVDRSGSMHGAPLDAVRASLQALANRMRPQDRLGIVTFDNRAEVAVPTRALKDHHLPTVHALIDGIHPGGTTDLSGGLLLGLTEARRLRSQTGASVLLLSDGHANAGITDPQQLGPVAAQAQAEGITIGTIGIGDGYDETLLAEISRQGSGAHRFALTPDDAIAVLAEEAGDLLAKSAINAFVRVRPHNPDHIDRIGTLHDVARWVEDDAQGPAVVIPLGDLFAGEERELLLHFDVPGLDSLGMTGLATLTIDYVALPSLEAQSIRWPLAVNVVPGSEAAKRVPDPTVAVAKLLAEVTQAKKEATEALDCGDTQRATALMQAEHTRLGVAISNVPDGPRAHDLRERLREEQAQADKLARSAQHEQSHRSRKSFQEDLLMESRGRNDRARRERSRQRRDF